MKKLGTKTTVNAGGEVISEKKNAMHLLPPGPEVCQICATDHGWNEPHNQQSLYYQMYFYSERGRYPTWTDAMAHCDDKVKKLWRRALIELLTKRKLEIPEDLS